MLEFRNRILRFILEAWVSIIGLRFYEGVLGPNNTGTLRTIFVLINGEKIEFHFYREVYKDNLYKAGAFKKVENHAFLVKGLFHPSLGAGIMRFNDSCFLFHGAVIRFFPDKVLADVILGIYIRYLQNHFETA